MVSTEPIFGGQSALAELPQRRAVVTAVTGLRHIKLWMLFPDKKENPEYFGVDWYDPFLTGSLMNEYGFIGLHAIDTLLSAYPCGPSSFVLQAGAHLGIYTLIAAAAGCHAFAIEGFRQHSHYASMTAALNGVSHLYHPIHALVGAHAQAAVPFTGFDQSKTEGKSASVPMVTIDDITRDAIADPAATFPFVIIDVEGFEADAMLGATKLLSTGQVLFWNIEVWLVKGGIRRTEFPYIFAFNKASYLIMESHGKVMTHADLVSLALATAEANKQIELLAVAPSVSRNIIEAVLASCNGPVAP